jgi:AcrR family transcriptional regulator
MRLADLLPIPEQEGEGQLDDLAGDWVPTSSDSKFWRGVIRRTRRIGSLQVSQGSLRDDVNRGSNLPTVPVPPMKASWQEDERREPSSMQRSLRREATRERILEAAARAFDDRGFLGVDPNDLMRELGLTRGVLYQFFPTKEGLAAEIVNRTFSAWEELTDRVLGEHDDLIDALIDMSYRVGRSYQTDSFTRASTRLSNERNLITTELPEPFVGWIERATQLLEAGKVRGQVRMSVDSEATALLMVSFFYGARSVCHHLGDWGDLLSTLDNFWDLMEPSLRPVHSPSTLWPT